MCLCTVVAEFHEEEVYGEEFVMRVGGVGSGEG